jgi:hypothetical protein
VSWRSVEGNASAPVVASSKPTTTCSPMPAPKPQRNKANK